MRLPRLASAALVLVLSVGLRSAFAADDAVALVTQFGDKTLQIISDPKIGATDRERGFHALIDQYFDFPAIARFVLGRYWQPASETERQQFTAAFEDHMVHAYVVRFSDYSGETFKVMPSRAEGESGTVVPAQILRARGQPPVVLDWKVQGAPASLRIRDVSISGVSMAVTYRDEFASMVQRNNGQLAVLIAALRDSSRDE